MSSEGGMTLAGFIIGLVGAIILILGIILVYFSLNTDSEIVNPLILTPFGVVIALIGVFMLITKKT